MFMAFPWCCAAKYRIIKADPSCITLSKDYGEKSSFFFYPNNIKKVHSNTDVGMSYITIKIKRGHIFRM